MLTSQITHVAIAIVIFTPVQIVSAMLTLGLALDIRNEKKMAEQWLKAHPKKNKGKTKNAVSDIRMTQVAK